MLQQGVSACGVGEGPRAQLLSRPSRSPRYVVRRMSVPRRVSNGEALVGRGELGRTSQTPSSSRHPPMLPKQWAARSCNGGLQGYLRAFSMLWSSRGLHCPLLFENGSL